MFPQGNYFFTIFYFLLLQSRGLSSSFYFVSIWFVPVWQLLETWRRGFHSRGWRRQSNSCGEGNWIIPYFSIYLKYSLHREHKLRGSLVRLVWNHLHKEPTIVARTHGCGCVDHRKVVAVDEGWAKGAEEGGAQETGCNWLLQERKQQSMSTSIQTHLLSLLQPVGGKKSASYLTVGR